jgi:hypothetical protein
MFIDHVLTCPCQCVVWEHFGQAQRLCPRPLSTEPKRTTAQLAFDKCKAGQINSGQREDPIPPTCQIQESLQEHTLKAWAVRKWCGSKLWEMTVASRKVHSTPGCCCRKAFGWIYTTSTCITSHYKGEKVNPKTDKGQLRRLFNFFALSTQSESSFLQLWVSTLQPVSE